MSLLVCEKVSKNFGGLWAINQLDFSVRKDEIVGLIGPNGSGKTTLFNLITGFLPLSSGTIHYEGEDISKLPPHVIAAHGLVRTFQKINVFPDLSVWENVIIGRHLHIKSGFLRSLLQSPAKHLEDKFSREEALRLLEFLGLAGWENQKVKNLPFGGLQRTLGIAVALAAQPKLLLLDEPASGMNPEEKKQIINVIRKIYHSGITLLLVEHDMNVVMNLCQRIVVLNSGEVLAQGSPEEIQRDPRVIEVYLGKGRTHAAGTR